MKNIWHICIEIHLMQNELKVQIEQITNSNTNMYDIAYTIQQKLIENYF